MKFSSKRREMQKPSLGSCNKVCMYVCMYVNAFVLDHQYGRCDVKCKPAISHPKQTHNAIRRYKNE